MLSVDLDFNSFFAINPELIQRNIGLQRDAFEGFEFNGPMPGESE